MEVGEQVRVNCSLILNQEYSFLTTRIITKMLCSWEQYIVTFQLNAKCASAKVRLLSYITELMAHYECLEYTSLLLKRKHYTGLNKISVI